MGDVGKSWQLEEARTVIIVSSTTGDGEQPENVIKFWRKLRPKTLPNDFLSNLNYTILGLGDTNYNEFCNGPKNLHRRLTELGGKTFYPPDWADDGTGLEIVVEPWLDNLWEALDEVVKKSDSERMDPSQSDALVNGISELTVKDETPLKVIYTLPACPKPFIGIAFDDTVTGDVPQKEFNNLPSQAGECFEGEVVECNLLSKTSPGREVKEYYNLILSCDDTKYNVGDTVGILCHNNTEDVEKLRNILREEDRWNKSCMLSIRADTAKAKAKLPPHLPSNKTTLQYLFTSVVDIRTVPKKLFVRALVEFTEDQKEKSYLSLLCSKEGAKTFSETVTEGRMSILELLDKVPSCHPPVTLLLEHLPRLLPRPYSISSSMLDSPGKISWLFTKVTSPKPGLATTWMSRLTSGDKLRLYPRTSSSFCPPEDKDQDYIMVAAGSGLGPFLAFMRDRKARIDQGEAFKGKCWLIFGCRYKDADCLCQEFQEDLFRTDVLDKISFAFSREDPSNKKYVQDVIVDIKDEFASWLIDSNATLYVCGDAKGMAAGVKKSVSDILVDKLGDNEGAEFMKKMIADKKYKEDIWT